MASHVGGMIAMRSLRFSIAALMGIILLVALGAAALRNASDTTAAVVSLVTQGVLCLAIVGGVCRTGAERTWWLGFAALGWTYLGLPLSFTYTPQIQPTRIAVKVLASLIGVSIDDSLPFRANNPGDFLLFMIAHDLLALVAAVAGGLLALATFGAARARSLEATPSSQTGVGASKRSWALPAMIVLSGLLLIASIAIACSRLDARISAGATYLLTWWLIGLTCLGALSARGRRREFWMGASLFGTGFMILIFIRPYPHGVEEPEYFLPTARFLEAMRPRLAALVGRFSTDFKSMAATGTHVEKALNQPVPIDLPDGTTLKEFLRYVQKETSGPNGEVIPIYVDPIGLSEADKTMDSTLRGVQLQGVALRTTLRLCLRQLDLTYGVRDGLILITSADAEDKLDIFPTDDPFQIAGHCLLALIAALLGGLAAPFVSDLAWSAPG